MSMLVYLPTLLSSIFRLAIYIFLRVIPTSLAKFILPVLYSTYLLSSILFIPQALDIAQSEKMKHVKPAPGPRYNAFQSLALSLPTTSRRLRFSNILLNTLLLIAAADYVVTPYLDSATDVVFTRVGAVYPDSVKIVVRYPLTNVTSQPPLLLYREMTRTPTPWKDGPLLTLLSDQDWVDTVKLEGLWPNTSYEYGLFTLNRTMLDHLASPLTFRTFPDPHLSTGSRFKFVVSSCATPNFPYRGPWYRRSIKGFDLLAEYLYPPAVQSIDSSNAISSSKADFMLFLGDFIYADVPIYIGDDKEAYRRLYRRNYNSDSFRKIYERLPIFHAYDDHEACFINNFGASGIDLTPPFLNASGAFRLYNSNANFDPASPGEYYYEFRFGDAAFFVMDTRRYRTKAGTSKRTMLGDVQLAALHNWLSRVNATSTFKFVITSVPFTSLWGHDAQTDSWAGFPEEKQELLKVFHSVPNIILLSGDRHEFAAIEFTSSDPESYPVLELSTSPLSMFYIPFVRTLRLRSDGLAQRTRYKATPSDNGTVIVSYLEDIPLERVIKYISTGNSKWSALEVDTTNISSPKLKLETVVDGHIGFRYELTGIPVKLPSSNLIGGVKDIIDKFGILPSKWF